MNKKVVLGLALLGFLYWQYGKKTDKVGNVNQTSPPDENESGLPLPQLPPAEEYFPIESQPAVYDELEGKVVYFPKFGNTFVIKYGEKWTISSEQALDDYIAKNPAHSKIPYELTLQEILSYPTAGHLAPGIRFVRN